MRLVWTVRNRKVKEAQIMDIAKDDVYQLQQSPYSSKSLKKYELIELKVFLQQGRKYREIKMEQNDDNKVDEKGVEIKNLKILVEEYELQMNKAGEEIKKLRKQLKKQLKKMKY